MTWYIYLEERAKFVLSCSSGIGWTKNLFSHFHVCQYQHLSRNDLGTSSTTFKRNDPLDALDSPTKYRKSNNYHITISVWRSTPLISAWCLFQKQKYISHCEGSQTFHPITLFTCLFCYTSDIFQLRKPIHNCLWRLVHISPYVANQHRILHRGFLLHY